MSANATGPQFSQPADDVATDEQFSPRGFGVSYDPSDMAELNALIAAGCRTPRAALAAKLARVETEGDVLRRVIERERWADCWAG